MTAAAKNWLARALRTYASDAEEPETWHDRSPEDGWSEADRLLVETLPFARTIVAGAAAMAEWTRLRARDDAYPVIVGADENLVRFAEQWACGEESAGEIIETARALDHPAGLVAARLDDDAWLRAWLGDPGAETGFSEPAPQGDWPDTVAAIEGPCAIEDHYGRLAASAHIVRVPTRDGCEVPAWLNWGGWNQNPHPRHHIAALRQWESDYGAELVALTGDALELRVARRPATRAEALALAREHHAYCPDILDRHGGELATLAASLMVSDWWYFWWD